MPLSALALALGLAASGPADLVRGAVEAALASRDARAEVLAVEAATPSGCSPREADVPRPVRGSGRVAVRLRGSDPAGRPCDAWAWARVRVMAPTLVASRELREGEPLADAVTRVEREVEAGRSPLAELPEGARAGRALPRGAALDRLSIRVGPGPGEPVVVALRSGALLVEERARAVACAAGRACALLPSGRKVEGAWHGGRIVIDTP